MTAIRAYPRNLLLTIRLAVIQAKPRVPLGVLEKLRQNNICSVPKTHRGVSGGKPKVRNILTVTTTLRPTHQAVQGRGMNWDNLINKDKPFPIVSRKDRRSKELCICLLNTQSTRNKIEIIRNSIMGHDIDILTMTMTETWLTSAAKDELFIKGLKIGGYDLFCVPREGNGILGGVEILYTKNLSGLSKTS